VVSAVVVLAVLAGSYQPLAYGQMESSVLAFPGLRAGQGIRTVNNVGGISEDFFVPPQGGKFSLFVSLDNTGAYPVTIERCHCRRLTRPAGRAGALFDAGYGRFGSAAPAHLARPA
jgi:hypothetical protein